MGCCCGGEFFLVPPCDCAPDGTPPAAVPCAVMRAKLEELLAALDPPQELPDVPCCDLACAIRTQLSCGLIPPEPPHPCYFIFDHPNRYTKPIHADKCYQWNVNNYCVGDPPPYSCGALPDPEVQPFELVKRIDRHEWAQCDGGCFVDEEGVAVQGCCAPGCPTRDCGQGGNPCDTCPRDESIRAEIRWSLEMPTVPDWENDTFLCIPPPANQFGQCSGGGDCGEEPAYCCTRSCGPCTKCSDSVSFTMKRVCPIAPNPCNASGSGGNFHCPLLFDLCEEQYIFASHCFHKIETLHGEPPQPPPHLGWMISPYNRCNTAPCWHGQVDGRFDLYCARWPDGKRYWTICGNLHLLWYSKHSNITDQQAEQIYCFGEGEPGFAGQPCKADWNFPFIVQGPEIEMIENPAYGTDPSEPRQIAKTPEFTQVLSVPRFATPKCHWCVIGTACCPSPFCDEVGLGCWQLWTDGSLWKSACVYICGGGSITLRVGRGSAQQ